MSSEERDQHRQTEEDREEDLELDEQQTDDVRGGRFIKLDPIKGESQDSKHAGQIDVL
jgi:hypothetical protein